MIKKISSVLIIVIFIFSVSLVSKVSARIADIAPQVTPTFSQSLTSFSSTFLNTIAPLNESFSLNSNLRVINNTHSNIVPSIANILNFLGFTDYVATSADSNLGPRLTEATRNLSSAFGAPINDTFDIDEMNAINTLSRNLNNATATLPAGVTAFYMTFPADESFSVFDTAQGIFVHAVLPPPPPSPPGCGGFKEPPCPSPQTYHCCDKAGWCTGDIPGLTCSGDGNTFCAGLPGGLGCRDVF